MRETSTKEAGTAKGLVQLKVKIRKKNRQVEREQTPPAVNETD